MSRFILTIGALGALMYFAAIKLFPTPPTWTVEITIFLVLTTWLVYFLLQKPKKKRDPEKFTQLYLLSITAKIIAACVFVITFILLDRSGADYNAIFFMAGYVIFTSAEVIFLLLKPAVGKP